MKKEIKQTDGNDYLKFLTREKDISDQIINHSRSMITIINRDYVYEKVNSTFCNAHKVVIDTILGRSMGDVWGHDTFNNAIKRNVDLCFSGKTVQYEATFITPQSGKRHFEVVFRPLSVEPGRVTHLLAETFDIDDLKNTKQAVLQKEEELRKFELMLETRLLQAQKLETIGSLAGGIAHDFNNILATISGYSEMLHEDLPKDSDSSEKVARILAAVKKAQSIISQILTFSRHVEQEKVLINVAEVLKETLGFIKSSIPANILLKSRIPRIEANVLADPTQLFRVFLNLMTNAIQAMQENGGLLTVGISVEEREFVNHELNKDIVADEYILISIKDTGEGMDPSLIGRIFEPFFTTREVGKGTGLGLSVIHGIITEMEGEIVVSSKIDEGSEFSVYLPVSKRYTNVSERSVGRKKILFITGNKYESRILSLALESAGYELIYISDARNFVKVMVNISERPDMVIYMSDSKQIKSEDLAELFRSQNIITPCILITDPVLDFADEKLLNSGIINQQLTKPVSLKEIRNAIQELLR